MARDEVRDAGPGRVLTGLNRRTRGRANRRRGIKVNELHPAGRQAIDARRFMKCVTKTGDIRPSHVIDQEKDNVGRATGSTFRASLRGWQ